MTYPILTGLVVLVVIGVAGYLLERWSWSKPLMAAGTIALIIATALALAPR